MSTHFSGWTVSLIVSLFFVLFYGLNCGAAYCILLLERGGGYGVFDAA